MTLPRAVSDMLILIPSFMRLPVAWVLDARSLPEKTNDVRVQDGHSLPPFFASLSLSLSPYLSLPTSLGPRVSLNAPARSTRLSFPRVMQSRPSLCSDVSTTIVKIECDRDDSAFMAVAPTVLNLFPRVWTASIAATESTTICNKGNRVGLGIYSTLAHLPRSPE